MKPIDQEAAKQALNRIEQGENTANYQAIIQGFASRGIPVDEIKPRENVFTYQAWQAKGRQVSKRPPHIPAGQYGVTIPVIFEKVDLQTKKVIKRYNKPVTVFHISQTYEIGKKPPQHPPQTGPDPSNAQNEPNHVQTGHSGHNHTPPPRKRVNPSSHELTKRVELLREKADSLKKQIDHKLNPPIANQNRTRRRIGIARSMREDGLKLLDTQRGLRAIADHLELGSLPEELQFVRSTNQVHGILHNWNYNDSAERKQLINIMEFQPAQIDPVALEIRKAEESLFGQKIPGFFPTPQGLADRMVQLADLTDDQEVLEPSAGKGDLAEAVLRHCEQNEIEVTLTCIETHYELCKILELKDLPHHRADFMAVGGTVDRIIMNPPYENGTDARHFLHAYDLLRPGGIVVALLGVGVTFRSGKVEAEFRAKLEHWKETGAANIFHYEKIDNAFKGSQSFNQTGVSCLLIAVRKGYQS